VCVCESDLLLCGICFMITSNVGFIYLCMYHSFEIFVHPDCVHKSVPMYLIGGGGAIFLYGAYPLFSLLYHMCAVCLVCAVQIWSLVC
jgi:multidrug efflux pump subunit AcrB